MTRDRRLTHDPGSFIQVLSASGRLWHRLTLDLWLAKDNRFLNPKSSYKRILMAPSCRFIPASWVGPYLVTLVGLRPPSLLVPLPTRVAAPPAGSRSSVPTFPSYREALTATRFAPAYGV